MTRDYTHFDRYLDDLAKDIYAQPPDHSHTAWAKDALKGMVPQEVKNVLDVGCGQGFLAGVFQAEEISWEGVTLGPDVDVCKANNMPIYEADVSFLPMADDAYDLILARHILEHSPFPVLTLMEWRRVSRKFLLLIAPAPDYWGWKGKNHYSMADKPQLRWWLERAGWKVIKEVVFSNNHEIYLKHWRQELINAGHLKADRARTHFPPTTQDIEYRFLCVADEEVAE